MNETLLDAFRRTDYLVCLSPLEWPCIHLDQPLPANLQMIVGDRSWAFITAWNPEAQRRSAEQNHLAQNALLDALNRQPEAVVHPAIGVGAHQWYEPSFFVIGPELAVIDALARQYRQRGFVHGHAARAAQLRLLES